VFEDPGATMIYRKKIISDRKTKKISRNMGEKDRDFWKRSRILLKNPMTCKKRTKELLRARPNKGEKGVLGNPDGEIKGVKDGNNDEVTYGKDQGKCSVLHSGTPYLDK